MNDEKFEAAKKKATNALVDLKVGTQFEKILHRTIKYYLAINDEFHEQKVANKYVDVRIDDELFEVQTRSFNNLRDKLELLLPKYKMTIVYPVCYKKRIYLIDHNGEVKCRQSPKKGNPFMIGFELYKIKAYLRDPNLKIKILLLDMEEYRNEIEKRHARSKSYLLQKQVPIKLIAEYDLNKKNDYCDLLKKYGLIDKFTTVQFKQRLKISKKDAYAMVNCLLYLEVLREVCKQNRSRVLEIVDENN